jgi:hypothetical protein
MFKDDELNETIAYLEARVDAGDLKDWPQPYCAAFAGRIPPELVASALAFAERYVITL